MKPKSLKRFSIMFGLIAVLMALFAASAVAKTEISSTHATNIGPHGATLHATIWWTPGGALYGFEYGTTTAYGSESEVQVLPPGSEFQGVWTHVTGLQPQTTYHYRIGVMDKDGKITYGPDRTFTTTGVAKFRAGAYPATLSAAQSGTLALSLESNEVTCTGLTADGTLGASSKSIQLAPTYTGCKAFGFEGATVATNGCSFEITAGEEVGQSGSLGIACPGEKGIEITGGTCKASLVPQAGGDSVATENEAGATDRVNLDFDVSGLKYVKEKDSFLCPFLGTGTKEDGLLEGDLLVSASDPSKNPIDLWVGY